MSGGVTTSIDAVVGADILGAGVERGQDHVVLGNARRGDRDDALALEHPGHAARTGQMAVVLGEDGPDFRRAAIFVVGGRLDQDGHAARPVALVGHFVVGRAREFARSLLDRALDVVDRHALAAGGGDGLAQARIEVRIAAAEPRRHRDFLGKLAEKFAPALIEDALGPLDFCPVRMARHDKST